MSSLSKVYIYVDDTRDFSSVNYELASGRGIIITKTYKEAIKALQFYIEHKAKIIIDLDHDLGSKKSGYDIAKWIVATGYQNIRFHIHSANPVGRKNMAELLTRYGYVEV
jgi:hypothetical protein